MRTALYCRVSSDRQAKEGDSIPAQLDALHKYAKEHKYTVVGEFIDDGISGTKNDREELQRMLSEVRAGKIELILVTKMDRLHRSLRNFLNMQDFLFEHNCNWLAIWEPMYDSTTPQGRMVINMMMNLAQFEAENTGSRIRQVFAYKAQKGEVLSGSVPPGYSIANKHLVPNELAPAVVNAFETYDRTNSINETIRQTTGTGLPVTAGGMKKLLQRRVYIGEKYGNENYCEPIIDRALFERVQTALGRNIKSDQKNIYLFGGLVKCAECGGKMSGSPKMSGRKQYLVYRCRRHYLRCESTCDNTKTITDGTIEKMMLDMLPNIIIERVEMDEKKKKPAANYERQKAKIEKKMERLKILFVNEEISLEEYRKDKAELQEQIAKLAPVSPPEPPEAILSLQGMDVKGIYETLTKEERRAFWRGLIKEIRFDKERHFYFEFL